MKKEMAVIVFGAFDSLHDGHRHFLRQAKALGDRLVVAVAPDEVIQKLKNRKPTYPVGERIAAIAKENIADEIVAGDGELGSWKILRARRPDIVALGYDQESLRQELEQLAPELGFTLVMLKPHEPDRLHSRFLRKDDRTEP